jgi:hypothetical protein
MVIPIYWLVGSLALPVALSPKYDAETRNVALRVLWQLEMPLDAHAEGLLRLSTHEEFQEQLEYVLRVCVSDRAFTNVLNRMPLDAIDVHFAMSVYTWRLPQEPGQPFPPSVKPFLYRVIRRGERVTTYRAVDNLFDWGPLTRLDYAYLHYLAWCGPIDLRCLALEELAERSRNVSPRYVAAGIVAAAPHAAGHRDLTNILSAIWYLKKPDQR